MSVTRQCYQKLTLTAWTLYVISMILLIVALSTDSWLVRPSTGQHYGIFPCCPSFQCGQASIAQAADWDAFLAVFCFGFILAIGGGVASVMFTWRNKSLRFLKCYYVIAVVIGLGGILLSIAAAIVASAIVSKVNSALKQYCISAYEGDVYVAGSFVAFVVGSIGLLLVSLPLCVAIPRVRKPLMIGDIVMEDGTEMVSAVSERGQRTPPNIAPDCSFETTQQAEHGQRMVVQDLQSSRSVDVLIGDGRERYGCDSSTDNVCEISDTEMDLPNSEMDLSCPDLDSPDLHKATPSAPELDIISEKSASINVNFEQMNLEDPTAHVTQINQSTCKQVIDRTEPNYFNLLHPDPGCRASSSTHEVMSKQVEELKETDSPIYEQYEVEQAVSERDETKDSLSEQSKTENPFSESSETEYATVEDMWDMVKSCNDGAQTESVYNNLPNESHHTERDCNVSSFPTNDCMTYELLETAHSHMEQKAAQHPVLGLHETDHCISELQIINNSTSEQKKLDQSINFISEPSESEYSTIEETLTKFVQLESVYYNTANLHQNNSVSDVSSSRDQCLESTSRDESLEATYTESNPTDELVYEDTETTESHYSNLDRPQC